MRFCLCNRRYYHVDDSEFNFLRPAIFDHKIKPVVVPPGVDIVLYDEIIGAITSFLVFTLFYPFFTLKTAYKLPDSNLESKETP